MYDEEDNNVDKGLYVEGTQQWCYVECRTTKQVEAHILLINLGQTSCGVLRGSAAILFNSSIIIIVVIYY